MLIRTSRSRWLVVFAFALFGANRSEAGEPSDRAPIKVLHAKKLPGADITAVRTGLGIPEDYKPWISRLKSGELLIVAFHAARNPLAEHAVLWRSRDGGRTWTAREPRKDVRGREFSLTCLLDGTLLMPCHILAGDEANEAGYTHSKLLRSTDEGRSWSEIAIGPANFPTSGPANTDRVAIEIAAADGSASPKVFFGVSRQQSADAYLWKSTDSGATWDRSRRVETGGWDDYDGFFGQSFTWRAPSGKLLHVVRVDARGKYWRIGETSPQNASGDQDDRMMLWESDDEGATWKRAGGHGNFGTYGEMYPRMLRLADGRTLLTFTVRANSTDGYPLGLRAISSPDGGRTWDFKHDRLVLEYGNVGPSGGGYGNTVQLEDGTLVTCYSFRGQEGNTHVEVMRWRLPEGA